MHVDCNDINHIGPPLVGWTGRLIPRPAVSFHVSIAHPLQLLHGQSRAVGTMYSPSHGKEARGCCRYNGGEFTVGCM